MSWRDDYDPPDGIFTVTFEVVASVRIVGDTWAGTYFEPPEDNREIDVINWQQHAPDVEQQVLEHIASETEYKDQNQFLPTLTLTFKPAKNLAST
jgi:hypothetical protein